MTCADFPETWALNLTECPLPLKSTTGTDAEFELHHVNKHTLLLINKLDIKLTWHRKFFHSFLFFLA